MSEESIKKLEQRISDLEAKSSKPEKQPKTPRKPSEYNKFMGEYISKHKDPKKPHKELFAEAVKAWNKLK